MCNCTTAQERWQFTKTYRVNFEILLHILSKRQQCDEMPMVRHHMPKWLKFSLLEEYLSILVELISYAINTIYNCNLYFFVFTNLQVWCQCGVMCLVTNDDFSVCPLRLQFVVLLPIRMRFPHTMGSWDQCNVPHILRKEVIVTIEWRCDIWLLNVP